MAKDSSERYCAREIFSVPETFFRALVCAAPPDSRDGDTDVHGGALVGVEQIGLQEDLAVSDGDHVGRDVGGHIVRLGLDDRQTRHRTAAQVIGDLGATFEQAGVQVEHITRVGFTPGGRRSSREIER